MGQGRSRRGRRVRATARSVVVLSTLGVFYAAAAYAHGGDAHSHPAGSLHVAMSGPHSLSVGADDLAAGDVVARAATLANRGKGAIDAIALDVDATRSSALDRDPRSGLRLRVDRCSTSWAAAADGSLHCGGRMVELVAWRPLASARFPRQLGGLPAMTTEWLRISLQLPPDASADVAGRRTTLRYRFTAE